MTGQVNKLENNNSHGAEEGDDSDIVYVDDDVL